ncbi:hypothetical protein Tco_0123646 [Tanacetum coccineum]
MVQMTISRTSMNANKLLMSVQALAPPLHMTSDHNSSELGIHDHNNELSSSKLVPKVVPPADKTDDNTTRVDYIPFPPIQLQRLRST